MNEKTQLLGMIAGKNRGILATESDRLEIAVAIERLEALNPTPHPLTATSLLEGNWRLLYTTSKGILGLERFPGFKLGQIYQAIRLEGSRIYNIAEIVGIPFLEGIVSVAASFEPVSDTRVKVNFNRSIIGLQKVINYQSLNQFIEAIEQQKRFPPLDFPITRSEQKGWLEVTYLDQDMRLGRGNEGNVFVLTKN